MKKILKQSIELQIKSLFLPIDMPIENIRVAYYRLKHKEVNPKEYSEHLLQAVKLFDLYLKC